MAEVFITDQLQENWILGTDWLEQENVGIDLPQRGLYFGREHQQVVYWQPARDTLKRVPPITLTEENVPLERRRRYERILNDFAKVFVEELNLGPN